MAISIGTLIPPRMAEQGLDLVAAWAKAIGLGALDLPEDFRAGTEACRAHGLRIGTVNGSGGGQLLIRDDGKRAQAVARLLEQIAWPSDGYRLFDIACLSGSCAGGFFAPFAESNCLCLPKGHFERLGGFDPAFVSAGGGYVNLDFYRRVCELPDSEVRDSPARCPPWGFTGAPAARSSVRSAAAAGGAWAGARVSSTVTAIRICLFRLSLRASSRRVRRRPSS